MKIRAVRYHDICAGHRVHGHENKCRHLHGHNYRVTFHCEADELDTVGRVLDFTVIKEKLCVWLEEYWDHKMLLWQEDPMYSALTNVPEPVGSVVRVALVPVPFNPTAENMAAYLLNTVAPRQLAGTGVRVTKVQVEETRKCSAEAEL
jgi:6-pyruvoyltetrahydropterin/6-carboxytetrahydropterin synthase